MREFKQKAYGLSVSIERPHEILYSKRRWVPAWLWRLVAEPDIISLMDWARYHAQNAENLANMDRLKL